jgi:hypothetical protein
MPYGKKYKKTKMKYGAGGGKGRLAKAASIKKKK